MKTRKESHLNGITKELENPSKNNYDKRPSYLTFISGLLTSEVVDNIQHENYSNAMLLSIPALGGLITAYLITRKSHVREQ